MARKTQAEYVAQIQALHEGRIEVLGDYINNCTKIRHRCTVDGYEWDIRPAALISNGQGCPVCSGYNKTHSKYCEQIQELHEGRIEVIGTYSSALVNTLHRCTIDGHEWSPTPTDMLRGRGCPVCAIRKSTESAGKIRRRKSTEEERQKARDMRSSGMSWQQIADALDRPPSAIRSWCNPEVAERNRIRSNQWFENNRERHYQSIKRYRDFEHGRANKNSSSAHRRAWKLEWYTHCPDDIAAMQAIYLECERITRETGIEHHVDHIWPLSLGGPHLPFNLQIITAEENLKKNASFSEADQAKYVQAINDLFNNH